MRDTPGSGGAGGHPKRFTTRGYRIPSSLPSADHPEGDGEWIPKEIALRDPVIAARVASVGISRLRAIWDEYKSIPAFVEAWESLAEDLVRDPAGDP